MRLTVSNVEPPDASVAAMTAPSTIGALHTTTRPRRSAVLKTKLCQLLAHLVEVEPELARGEALALVLLVRAALLRRLCNGRGVGAASFMAAAQ